MAVSPMDLQVLFMQEGKVANQAEKKRKSASAKRSRLGRKTAFRSLQENVDAADEIDSKMVDGEGGQSANYFPRRRHRREHSDEKSGEEKASSEQGKGGCIDLTA